MEDLSLVSMKELAKLLGLSYATVKRWRRDGRLPIPFAIDGNRTYWTRTQILEWQRGLICGSRGLIRAHPRD